jgi:hypothetical protein
VATVPTQIVQPDERARVAVQILREGGAPERAARGQARSVGGQSAPAMLVFEEREMRCHLATQFCVAAIGAKDVE